MSNRFSEKNANIIMNHLHSLGIQARLVEPSTSLDNGCTDECHCMQHNGFTYDGQRMKSIDTKISNTRLHKIAIELKLIKE
jgi:hypothetical protein